MYPKLFAKFVSVPPQWKMSYQIQFSDVKNNLFILSKKCEETNTVRLFWGPVKICVTQNCLT